MRDQRSTATHRPAGRLLRWVLVVTVGEAIGFLVPAVVGAAVTAAAWAPLPTLIAMVLAGSVEGAVLGAAQSDCLHRWGVLPLRRRWIAATSLGAAVAWSLGMLPVMVGGLNCDRNGRTRWNRWFDLAQLSAAGPVLRAS